MRVETGVRAPVFSPEGFGFMRTPLVPYLKPGFERENRMGYPIRKQIPWVRCPDELRKHGIK